MIWNTTVLNYADGKQAVIEGGQLIRNQTDGYVIKGGKISGDTNFGSFGKPQNLISQSTQDLVIGIMQDATDFLKENGESLTKEQLDDTAKNLLSVVGSLTQSVEATLNNPLWSDLQHNLNTEKENYDAIFNVLPENIVIDNSSLIADIRYVESNSEEEWAQEATRLVQQAIGKKMANQMQATMATLEDTFAKHAISNGQIPYNNTITENGNTLVVLIGNSEYMLNKNLHCDSWTVKFPPSVTDLAIANLTDDTNYRVGMWCYGRNPFMYTLNFDLLITSGALELHLKHLDGSPIM
ncbi:putative flagellar protein FliS [Ancylostoma ceylanicum]|uniref:Putative flagellar protein FliS n=1 Tax=Ancylostoma ceylanicum TaxID=53326 RepID=A0A0D6LVA5_9BILA|nr:putative flagellar protein FliS [Ancylostoma ceylanicum]